MAKAKSTGPIQVPAHASALTFHESPVHLSLVTAVSRGEKGGQFRGELEATFPEVTSRNSQRPKGLGVAAVSSHWPPPRRESGIFLSRANNGGVGSQRSRFGHSVQRGFFTFCGGVMASLAVFKVLSVFVRAASRTWLSCLVAG